MTPDTRYTNGGGVSIAYQVIGDGPIDLVLVPGWLSNIEVFWEEPNIVRFFQRLAAFSRLIVFDKRLGKRIFAAIQTEWQRTNDALSMITGEPQRLASNPSLARSIEHRFPYLDPLNHLQVELMRRHRTQRADDPSAGRVDRGIHITINGLAAGLRNTG